MTEDYPRQPLPAVLHDAKPLEYGAVLDEFPPQVGLPLWQVLRDATLWISSPPMQRPRLFSRVTRLDPDLPAEIAAPLSAMLRGMRLYGPAGVELIAGGCVELSEWAERKGFLATSLAYAQCAALAVPRDAAMALRVGRLAMERAEYSRAETWFRRALPLARQSERWEIYIASYIGLGTIYQRRGKFPTAEEHFRRALRLARRYRLRTLAAMAYHDLFGAALQRGRPDEAEKYARQAFRLYRPGDPHRIRLANDTAYQWIIRRQFLRAIPILESILPHLEMPSLRLIALTNLVRATGGARMMAAFHEAWTSAEELVTHPGAEGVAAACLMEMARGAVNCGEWLMAESAARSALDLATSLGQAQVRSEAEALLSSFDQAGPECRLPIHRDWRP